jgi:hypothetical protein
MIQRAGLGITCALAAAALNQYAGGGMVLAAFLASSLIEGTTEIP